LSPSGGSVELGDNLDHTTGTAKTFVLLTTMATKYLVKVLEELGLLSLYSSTIDH